MKKILLIFCIIMALYAIYFPLTFFGSNNDKMEVMVSHILVDSREDAEKIKQELENGKDFGELARENSKCESKYYNGKLGYMQRGRLNKEVETVVFDMPVNKLSEPVKSKYGWHILKVSDIHYYSSRDNFVYNPYRYIINI